MLQFLAEKDLGSAVTKAKWLSVT